jgi:probable DNA metabolism protein
MRVPENFLFYLSLHENCTQRHLHRAMHLSPMELEISCNPEMRRLKQMVYAVMNEMHKQEAFVRLKPLGPCALYGHLKPRHRIGAHICDHFSRRNPGVMILLGNSRESWIALLWEGKILHGHGDCLQHILNRLRSGMPERSSGSAEAIWKVYYGSQYCSERKNLALFRSRMPKRCLKSMGTDLEQSQCHTSLSDFINDEQA